ncbi:MAG: bifunctional phosphoribosylaminoimidazolecarboxamide formyltransferase/IMP cyclohydrolase PurH, partial [Bdellovibrio sp. CG10_big_fil_rev_8_21_14_0_10_47_8]
MFKNALVSVSDKTGLVEFLKPLAAQGLRIVSTGGTAKHLKENGLQVVDVSEQTQFPEVMGGRVKTLHPLIHMALLARTGHAEDEKLLKQYGLEPFDLVICNLYPFEESLLKSLPEEEMIENIDIGGPTVLRASAKCFDRIAVICHPQDYAWISQKSELNSTDRKKLAAKVFSHVSSYDSLVSAYLDPEWGERFSLAGHKVMSLRYGENPQQAASWYRRMGCDSGLHSAEILQGKVLSYNNLLDLDAAVGLVQALEHPSAVAVKHNNPCGVATADSLAEAVVKALKSDPISVFGGIIAVNRKITQVEAEALQGIFLECLIAPDYEPQALEIFSRKKNFRVLKWPDLMSLNSDFDLKTVQGGFLIQKKDVLSASTETWKIKG